MEVVPEYHVVWLLARILHGQSSYPLNPRLLADLDRGSADY